MSNCFEVKELNVCYSGKQVVHNVSLAMNSREFNAILGRNGSGKTTLIKGILGLLKTRGTILFNEEPVIDLNIKDKATRIGYIAQRTEVTYSIRVKDIISMGLNPHLSLFEAVPKHQENKVMATAKELGLETLLDEDYLSLSEGQKQLVIIARAVLQDTGVLLLDEPDSAMDFVVRHTILEKLKEIAINHNKMALIAMHDPNFALAYCDKIFLMKDGRLIETIYAKSEERECIKHKLQLIYGAVDLLEHNESYYMVKA